MPLLLQQDPDMLELLEADLRVKADNALLDAGVQAGVHGVFSIDDLEDIEEGSLSARVAIGVGYAGADGVSKSTTSQPGGKTVAPIDFLFHVILACPHGPCCPERHSATKLLTVLRLGIHGSTCDGDRLNRAWLFQKEFPNVSESTESMLYYSQIWLLRMMQNPATA